MTTEPETTTPALAMMPISGELVDLNAASTDTLAEWRMRTIEVKRELDALASDLDQVIARRIDYESAGRTIRAGDFELEVTAPTVTEWDLPRLSIALEALVTDGRIARPVAEKAIRTTVTRTAAAAHLKQLMDHADPEVRESVARCRHTVENTRRRVAVRLVHD